MLAAAPAASVAALEASFTDVYKRQGIGAGFGSVRCNDGVGAIAVLVDTGQTVALKVLTFIFQFAADFSAFCHKTGFVVFFHTEVTFRAQTVSYTHLSAAV